MPSDDKENGWIQGTEIHVQADAWLGASQTDTVWSWADQSPYAYQNWTTNPPSGTNQCALVHTNDKWDPAACGTTHPFVCECPP